MKESFGNSVSAETPCFPSLLTLEIVLESILEASLNNDRRPEMRCAEAVQMGYML